MRADWRKARSSPIVMAMTAPMAAATSAATRSCAKAGCPPDPPTGHGRHRYCFQLFALGVGASDPGPSPGRAGLVEAMQGHVLAAGLLTGTYDRGERIATPRAAPAAA